MNNVQPQNNPKNDPSTKQPVIVDTKADAAKPVNDATVKPANVAPKSSNA